jgi:hypothetical protein
MEPVSNVPLASDAALEQILAHAATLQHQAIAVRAHQVFLERGGTHGHDLQDWLVAKRQLFNSRQAPRFL